MMPPLRGKDFMLRPFRAADVQPFAAAVRESMGTVGAWMPWARHDYNTLDAQEWFARCDANMADGSAFDIGVFSPDGRELYGGVAINQIRPEDNLGNLGYWIRESRQRQGLAAGAATMMACHGFHGLGLTRIEIVAAEANVASRAVAVKIGATLECIARNRLILRGRPVAAAVYSLVPEWFPGG
ncbi:putative ribosomal N-acetyltransferase YdaF [compost metagenome]